jgi:ATP-binding protein involved in chromosome partitioning
VGEIPIAEKIMEGSDSGKPVTLEGEGPLVEAFYDLAKNVIRQVEIRNAEQPPTEKVKIKYK